MGDDDRRGRSSRPGGRAPWERYPGPESDENAAAPRNRRTDEPKPTTQLTVHDLVQRVDSERIARRRKDREDPPGDGGRNAQGDTAERKGKSERGARQPGNRGRTTDDSARPASATGANRTAPRGGGRNSQSPATPPGRGGAPRTGDAGAPANRGRNATPASRPGGHAAPGTPPSAPRAADTGATGATPRGRKGTDPRAAQGNRATGPEQPPRATRSSQRRPAPDQRQAPAAPVPARAPQAPGAAAGSRGAAPTSDDAQSTTVYRATGADTPPDRQSPGAAAPAVEQVTDQLPMPCLLYTSPSPRD